MGRRGPLGCGDLQSYYKRTAAIARHLEQESMWWRRKQGRDFLVLNSFYWLKDAVGKELLSALLKGPAIFTTSDRNYVDFLAINATVTLAVALAVAVALPLALPLPVPVPVPLPLPLALARQGRRGSAQAHAHAAHRVRRAPRRDRRQIAISRQIDIFSRQIEIP